MKNNKTKNSRKPVKNVPVSAPKVIHGYQMYKMEANLENQKRDLVKRIKAKRFNLKTLRPYMPYPEEDEILDKPLQNILNSSNTIHTLKIDLYARHHIFTEAGFASVCQMIRGRTSLKNLGLIFGQRRDGWFKDFITSSKIERICGALKTLSSLQTLSLNFHGCREMTDEGLEKLSGSLETLSSLRKIHLSFAGCSKISNVGVNNLCKAFKGLGILEDLVLDLRECEKIDNLGIQSLSQALKKLVSLRTIDLDLPDEDDYGGYGESDEDDEEGAEDSEEDSEDNDESEQSSQSPGINLDFSGLKIEKLRLNFSGLLRHRFNHVTLSNLGQSLKKVNSLKQIDLKFACCAMTDEGVLQISEALKSLPSLQSLHLDFTRCDKLTDAALGLKLKSFRALKQLSLNFSKSPNLNNEGIEAFSKILAHTKLERLNLDFSESYGLSDDNGWKHLYVALKKLKELNSLSLSLGTWSGKIFNIGKEKIDLGSVLNKLTSLQTFSLCFTICPRVDKNGVKNLCSGLKNHPSLKSLSLDFCFPLESEDAASLWKAIRTLTLLQNLSIQLWFQDLPEEAFLWEKKKVDSLCDAFRALVSLKTLDLQFPLFDKDCLGPFGETLKTLDNLETINFKYVADEDASQYDSNVEKNFARTLAALPGIKNLCISCRGRKHWWI